MCKRIVLLITVCLVMLPGNLVGSDSGLYAKAHFNTDQSGRDVERIAVMPFLTGQLESPDSPIENPLSQPLAALQSGELNLAEGGEQVLTRLVHNYLDVRYRGQIVALEDSSAAHTATRQDATLDTPRKLAVQFGKILQADLVIVGTVWRFRNKGPDMAGQDKPAAVAFSIYLVEVESGERLWRGAFDGSQKVLSEDVLGGLKQAKIGLRWISVTELARLGVKQAFKRFSIQ